MTRRECIAKPSDRAPVNAATRRPPLLSFWARRCTLAAMATFRVTVYGAEPRHGAKPCYEFNLTAASQQEAVNQAQSKLDREKAWWVAFDAQPA
jgi:hypothetical protein